MAQGVSNEILIYFSVFKIFFLGKINIQEETVI